MKKIIWTIVAVVILAALGWYFLKPAQESMEQGNNGSTASTTVDMNAMQSSSTKATAGWKTYSDQEHRFTIKYPSDWNVNPQLDLSGNGFVVFQPKDYIGSTTNSFTVSVRKIDPSNTTNGNAQNTISAYSKLFNNMEKESVSIDGQIATNLIIQDVKVPIHAMRIVFDRNGYTYGILESGPVYYGSSIFTTFYQSFKFTN